MLNLTFAWVTALTCNVTVMLLTVKPAALPLMLGRMPDRSPGFLVWSSVIVFGFAVVHGVGIWLNWARLGG